MSKYFCKTNNHCDEDIHLISFISFSYCIKQHREKYAIQTILYKKQLRVYTVHTNLVNCFFYLFILLLNLLKLSITAIFFISENISEEFRVHWHSITSCIAFIPGTRWYNRMSNYITLNTSASACLQFTRHVT